MSERPKLSVIRECPTCKGKGKVWDVNPAALRYDRESRGLSLRDVAKLCGVSAAFVCDVELGRRAWSPRLTKGYPCISGAA